MSDTKARETSVQPTQRKSRPVNMRNFGSVRRVLIFTVPVTLLFGFFVIPLIVMLAFSFFAQDPVTIFRPTFDLNNYAQFFEDSLPRSVLIRTIWVSALATLICLILGYALVLLMRGGGSVLRAVSTVLVLTPILVSDVILGYAWLIMLGPNNGVIQRFLTSIGLPDEPLKLLYTDWAVLLGLVYFGLGFMVLNLRASLDSLDDSLLKAAAILGAGPIRRFRTIILPLTIPGVVSGTLITFAMTMSAFILPLMLGGNRSMVLSVYVYNLNTTLLNWPLGAAGAFILLIIAVSVSGLVLLFNKLDKTNITRLRNNASKVGTLANESQVSGGTNA